MFIECFFCLHLLRLLCEFSSSLLLLFSRSAMSDSWRPQGLQHSRLSCPSPSPELAQTHVPMMSVMPSNHIVLCRPLLLPSIFPSIRVFSNELALHIRWPKYWTCFSISLSSEYSGLISFRIDWFNLLAALNLVSYFGFSHFKLFFYNC